MTALAANRALPDTKQLDNVQGGMVIDYAVQSAEIIYAGAFVKVDSTGYIAAAGGTDTVKCVGVAQEKADNSAGANGAKTAPVLVGAVIDHAVTGATVASIGSKVYAKDDQTLTMTSTSHNVLGYFIQLTGAAKGLIKCAWPGQA
ncbi:MAG: DUF2190 family protein [Phycisphaerales bacterium]|nr:MAG: DUF2190 family protein [Phycisphaerales bacterium]